MKTIRFMFVLIGLVALSHVAGAGTRHASPAMAPDIALNYSFQPGLPPPPPRPPFPHIRFGHRRAYHHVYHRHYYRRRHHRY